MSLFKQLLSAGRLISPAWKSALGGASSLVHLSFGGHRARSLLRRPLKELSEQKQITIRTARIFNSTGVVRRKRARIFVPERHEKSTDERQVKSILAGN